MGSVGSGGELSEGAHYRGVPITMGGNLYSIYFVLETNANTLIAQLNRAITDFPGALIIR